MAKRKKGSKVQSRAKLRKANSAKRPKARKAAKAVKRTVAKAKPKPAPVKKATRKAKQPVAAVVETVAAEVIEQPAPGAIAVTEVEETEIRKAADTAVSLNRNAQEELHICCPGLIDVVWSWADDASASLLKHSDIA